jgi:hypothetical protein
MTRGVVSAVSRALSHRRHSSLLGAIVALMAVRPLIGDTEITLALFSALLLVVLLGSLLSLEIDNPAGAPKTWARRRRWWRLLVAALALLAIGERAWIVLVPNPVLLRWSTLCWGLLFFYVTWSQLRRLLRKTEITGKTISMSISIYLLFGLSWGLLYVVIFQSQPSAFYFADGTAVTVEQSFPIFVYFSLTTLSTVGFGDITPLTLPARYAAVAEGIAGQFYLAILVARLVGMHLSQARHPTTRP